MSRAFAILRLTGMTSPSHRLIPETSVRTRQLLSFLLATLAFEAGCKSGSSATATETVAAVSITPTSASVAAGSTQQLTATPLDQSGSPITGRTITWSSAEPGVATVSSTGLVTGVTAGGPVTITASAGGVNGTAMITVTPPPVATVSVDPATASIQVGASQPFSATLHDAGGHTLSGRTVTWSSSNAAIASVSNSGAVTGVTIGGPVTITATSEGKSGTAMVTVTAVPVATVAVSPDTGTIAVGSTLQLAATPKDNGGNALQGRTVTWTSSNPAFATVSASGLVTALAPGGPVTVTATSEGIAGTATVNIVSAAAASVDVSGATELMVSGTTEQLAATPKDGSGNVLTGKTIVWASSAPAVATISSDGLVTAVAAGTATFTATVDGTPGNAATRVIAAKLLSAGNEMMISVGSDHHIWVWGEDDLGELGDGGNAYKILPFQAVGISNAVSATAGLYTMAGVLADGTMRMAGINADGELGDGTTTASATPVQAMGLTGVVAVAASWTHTLVLRNDGTVWSFGYNAHGQLGDGTFAGHITPQQIPGLTHVIAIATVAQTSYALRSDGTVWAWGDNSNGMLGDGMAEASRATPAQVAGLPTVLALNDSPCASLCTMMVVGTDGSVWGWGYNASGQLDDGSTTSRSAPVKAQDISNAVAVASQGHTLVLLGNGTVMSWGSNTTGELGNGSVAAVVLTPAIIPGLSDVRGITVNNQISGAYTSGGVIMTWGSNAQGALGIGIAAGGGIDTPTTVPGRLVPMTP